MRRLHKNSMHRFFVDTIPNSEKPIIISGEIAHQICKVLRMRPGDSIVLCPGDGEEYTVRLSTVSRDSVVGEVMGHSQGQGEPLHAVTLYLSLLNKPDKFEWALQKCTELGVSAVVPVLAERSVAGPPDSGRRQRWQRIMREAAEQSGRSRTPRLGNELAFPASVENALGQGGTIALLAAPGTPQFLRDLLRERAPVQGVSVMVGPEGGFTEGEISLAAGRGVTSFGLGPRTLRAETAAVTALALIMHELGELGSSSDRGPRTEG